MVSVHPVYYLTVLVTGVLLALPGSPSWAQECGDVDSNGSLLATDALLALQRAVGQPVTLICPPGGLPQTGQTTCYDGVGAVIDCEGTGQDGELQKGVARSFTDNGNGTVTDNVTGLMWEKLSDDGTINDMDNKYRWSNTVSKSAQLNQVSFAGHNDWREPNIAELWSLVDFSRSHPAIDPAFNTDCAPGCTVLNCSCTVLSLYWSASSIGSQDRAWVVNFSTGGVDYEKKQFNSTYVRAVRGG